MHRQTSRREFLKYSAAVLGAGVGVPYFWSSQQAKAQSANDRLGVGAIGVGKYTQEGWNWGRGAEIAFQARGFGDIVACCDVDRKHADLFTEELGGKCDIYEDFRKLLDRNDVDVVTIGTPDHWHTPIAVAALRRGKDVYCEKPLTLTIDESKLLRKTVEETGRVLQVGTQQRSEFGLCFLRALALIRKGLIGRVHTATCSIGEGPRGGPFQEATPPATLNWDFWLGQAPAVPYIPERCHYNFRWWLEYSGGKLTDWGAHHIDIAQWGLGKDLTGPVEIEGCGEYPTGTNGYNSPITFKCDLRFEDGAIIHVQHGPDNGILFEGTEGKIFVNRGRLSGKAVEQLTPADDEWINTTIKELYKGREPGSHMRNFFECVRDREQPISDVFTHHRTISSCHLCNIAMRLGRKLQWDPVQEDVLGDDEAHKMLGREQREPYSIERLTS